MLITQQVNEEDIYRDCIERAQLESQLQLSEALVAAFQKALQQRDSELEILRSKVGHPSPSSLDHS